MELKMSDLVSNGESLSVGRMCVMHADDGAAFATHQHSGAIVA